MKIQAAVYYPVVVDIDIDVNNPQQAREEILKAADCIINSTTIKPTIENVVALAEDGKSSSDITSLLEERIVAGSTESQRKPRYRIACWIPIEAEEREIYKSLEDARRDLEHYQALQPENIYKLEVVGNEATGNGGNLEGLREEN